MPDGLKAFSVDCKGRFGRGYFVVFAENQEKARELAEQRLIHYAHIESAKDIRKITELDPSAVDVWLLNDEDYGIMPEDAKQKAEQPTDAAQADKGWIQTKYSQEEVSYTDYAVRRNPVNSVCQTCRWFINRDFSMDGASNCHIVECYPLDIVGTGYCNQWTARKIVEPEPMAVVLVEESDDMDSEEMNVGMMARYGVDVAPPVVDDIPQRKGLQRLFGGQVDTSFKVLANGMWLAFHTNNILDSDDEILKAKAHKDYVARVKAGLVEMPELWRGHVDGTAHGKALHVDYIETDGVVTVFAIGVFDKSTAARNAQRSYKMAKPGEISLSHGFLFPKWAKKDGEYEVYNTFEISTLIRGQEANEFTNFSTKGNHMPLSEAQIKDMQTVFGDAAPDIIKRVEERGKADKAVADLGAKYKGYVDFADVNGTDDTANKAADAPTIEAFKALIPTLLEDSGTFLTLVQAMDKRLDTAEKAKNEALEAKNAALENRVKALETLLEMKPTAASEAASTVVAETAKLTPEQLAALPTEVKAMLESLDAKQSGNAEFDPFFGDLKVKKAR